MVYDPARVAEPTGRAHWPLDANVDVVVVAEKVSKDLNDLKVSITQASLYPILCHLGNTSTQASCTPTSHSTQEQPGRPSDPHDSVLLLPVAHKHLCSPSRTPWPRSHELTRGRSTTTQASTHPATSGLTPPAGPSVSHTRCSLNSWPSAFSGWDQLGPVCGSAHGGLWQPCLERIPSCGSSGIGVGVWTLAKS